MKTERVKQILQSSPDGHTLKIEGWVRTKRDSKNVCFFEVNDGSCLAGLQIIIEKDSFGNTQIIQNINTGAAVEVEGVLRASPGKGQNVEVVAAEVTVFGEAPEDYPLQKKRHSFEYLREIAHLRPRTNTFGAITRVRHQMSYSIHKFFHDRGFYYIHTPIITASDAEGAGEMFQVTTLPLTDIPKSNGSIDYSKDFFGKQAALTVSGQLEAEIYALALKNVYTFGPTFRAENSNTSRHLAEFWMIEPEVAFCDITGNMDLAEEFIKVIFRDVLDQCQDDMEFFNKWIQPGILDNHRHILESDFVRITYTEAVNELKKTDVDFEYPVSWGADLQAEHEKFLTEQVYKKPVIVTDYPKEIKAFYMKCNEDGKTVRAMDVLVPRLGEIIGGSERESNYTMLKSRIEEMGLDEKDYWWYLDLRRYGTVPHAGFGLGFERLIQYVTGMQNIRDVIPFPRAVRTIGF